jgi:hypothetical protein
VPEATDPLAPDSLTELGSDNRAKKRRVAAIILVGVPLLLGGGGYALLKMQEARHNQAIRDAWRRAAGCLLDVPLEAGQKASVRVRRMQLQAVLVEKDPHQPNWPERCADPVANVNTVLRAGARNAGPEGELSEQAEKLALLLRKAGQLSDLSAPVDAFFEAGRRAGFDGKDLAPPPQPPPQPKEAFDVDLLPKTALVSPLSYAVDSLSTPGLIGPELHLLTYDMRLDKKPILCTFGPAGPEATCRKLGGEIAGKPGLALEGTADPGALPLVIAGQHGAEGVFRADTGERLPLPELAASYVAKDGYVAAIGRVDPETGSFKLVEQRPGEKLEKHRIEPKQLDPEASQIHRLNLLWNKLVIQTYYEDNAKAPRLQYLELPAKDPSGPFKDIGELNWLNAAVQACRSGDTLSVRFGGDGGYLTFFHDARWTKPLPVQRFDGAAMSCDGPEAVMDWVGGQQRCTSGGCKRVDGAASKFDPFNIKRWQSGDINGKQLLLAQTDDGGMRYRMGPGEHGLLFDDRIKDAAVQAESTLIGSKLYARGRFAVLMMSTPAGMFALWFDANGKPWPAKIVWA